MSNATSSDEQAHSYFPRWKLKTSGVIMPEERLPWGQTIVSGLQHCVAMSGSTIIAPLLMGFDPNVAVLFSGIGTLIFFVIVAGRVPSYLGSSFAFIAVVLAATGYAGHGPNPNISVALGGIVGAGVLYGVIALIVMWSGIGWVERLMPPAVTGAVVAAIGLNLAPVAVKAVSANAFETWIGLATVLIIGVVAVAAPGMWRRLPIILGAIGGYLLYLLFANGLGFGKPIDFTQLVGRAVVRSAELHHADLPCRCDLPDRAGRDHSRRREPRPHQGRRRHDGPEPRWLSRPRAVRRQPRDDRGRLRRRHRCHDLRREHRCHGGDEGLFDACCLPLLRPGRSCSASRRNSAR